MRIRGLIKKSIAAVATVLKLKYTDWILLAKIDLHFYCAYTLSYNPLAHFLELLYSSLEESWYSVVVSAHRIHYGLYSSLWPGQHSSGSTTSIYHQILLFFLFKIKILHKRNKISWRRGNPRFGDPKTEFEEFFHH